MLEILSTYTVSDGAQGRTFAVCRCHCGTIKVIRLEHVKSGDTTSCGCVKRQLAKERMTTHGEYGTPLYTIWKNLENRSEQWNTYEAFRADIREVVQGMFFSRPDPSKPFGPNNYWWVTQEQIRITYKQANPLTMDGETLTIGQWAKKLGIGKETIRRRLERGWTVKDALRTQPVIGRNQHTSEDYYDFTPRSNPKQVRKCKDWKPKNDCKIHY